MQHFLQNGCSLLRVFEVMACGCFLLTNRIRDNGFSDLFEDGRHLVTYATDRELVRKIDHFLSHDDERRMIAQAGRELVLSKHTYFHRVQTMFNYLAFKFGGEFYRVRI